MDSYAGAAASAASRTSRNICSTWLRNQRCAGSLGRFEREACIRSFEQRLPGELAVVDESPERDRFAEQRRTRQSIARIVNNMVSRWTIITRRKRQSEEHKNENP